MQANEFTRWVRDNMVSKQKKERCEEDEPCKIAAYFHSQLQLPPILRSRYVHLCCTCRRCNPRML